MDVYGCIGIGGGGVYLQRIATLVWFVVSELPGKSPGKRAFVEGENNIFLFVYKFNK